MPDLVSEAVTFLFTDIEGSTRLWEEHPEAMRVALANHDDLLRACIESHGGRVFKTVGDAFCAAFADPRGGLDSVLASQQWLPALALITPDGTLPLKVRMALHTGVVEERDGDYFGQPLNRVARLLATAHGGQVIVSAATQELARDNLPPDSSLISLGEHRLKDLSHPETVFQLLHPALPGKFPPLRSLDNLGEKHNLPQQMSSFVGREAEMAAVRELLGKTRLLTLTGSGGGGKTRLSLQVAADLLETRPDGVWLVELAPLADPSHVQQAIATVFKLREEPGASLLETISGYLKHRKLLLVLDNCEHVLTECARLAEAILRHCPGVTILASSREGLGIAGELTHRVPSLTLPEANRDTTPEAVVQFEAVRLFVERAEFHQPQFAVTQANAPALASICRRLDGIPLAIELAAARVRSMSAEEINQRLDQRFRLLTGGSRTALPRQQTLRSLIDWSYDLLTPQERFTLERVSVFAGGWTLAAAEAVCAGDGVKDWEVLDLLTSLTDKSLVLAAETNGVTRYRLLETVRQYARDRLLDHGQGEEARRRHRDYFLTLAREMNAVEEARLDELDNFRAALESCLDESPEGARAGLELVDLLYRLWFEHNLAREGAEWAEAVLALPGAQGMSAERARALHISGTFQMHLADYERAARDTEAALEFYRTTRDAPHTCKAQHLKASIWLYQGRLAEAYQLFLETKSLWEKADPTDAKRARFSLGVTAKELGRYDEARSYLEPMLAASRRDGDKGLEARCSGHLSDLNRAQGHLGPARELAERGVALDCEVMYRPNEAYQRYFLARVACDEGSYAEARAQLRLSLEICRELHDWRIVPKLLESVAEVALLSGEATKAARLYGAAEVVREVLAVLRSPHDQIPYTSRVAETRAALGEAAFDAAWAEGRALTLEQAIELALQAPDA